MTSSVKQTSAQLSEQAQCGYPVWKFMYLLTQMNLLKKHHMTQNNKIPLPSLKISSWNMPVHAAQLQNVTFRNLDLLNFTQTWPYFPFVHHPLVWPTYSLMNKKKVNKTWIYLPSEYKQFKLKLHEVSNAFPFLFTQTR